MEEKEIRSLESFGEITSYLSEEMKENEVFEVALVETRLHYKQGRRYKAKRFHSSDEAAELGHKLLPRYLDRECIFAIGCTAKMEPLSIHLLSVGSMNASILEPARLLTFLLLSGAHSFLLYHNHPSGDTTPSTDDITSTKRIQEASRLVGLKLVDHIIIGDGFTSMKERGYI